MPEPTQAPTMTEVTNCRLEASLAYADKVELSASTILRTLGDEGDAGPRLFSLEPVDRGKMDPRRLFATEYRLRLWCEQPGCRHPLRGDEGTYIIREPRKWLVKWAPYLRLASRVLRLAVRIVPKALDVYVPVSLPDGTKEGLVLMEEIASQALDQAEGIDEPSSRLGSLDEAGGGSAAQVAEGASLRALHHLLRKLDPGRQFGGLQRVVPPTGGYLWVCPAHHKHYDPGLPILPT